MCVYTIKQGLRSHPLDRQAALEEEGGKNGVKLHRAYTFHTRPSPHLIPMYLRPAPHIAGFLIVVNMVDATGQPEVSDLHHIVLSHQYISGSQVPVDALRRGQGTSVYQDVSGSCAHHFTVSPRARVTRPRTDEKWNGQRPGLNPQHQRKEKEEAHTCTTASFASPLG